MLMPFLTMGLYAASIALGLILLAMVVATGNARGLASAITWMAVDLAVTALSLVLCRLVNYAASYYPIMMWVHAALYAACLIWMGVDAHNERHPLSTTFFAGFGVYAICKILEYALLNLNGWHASGTVIWYFDTAVYFIISGVLLFSLFAPIPPETQKQKTPRVVVFPMAALARVRR